MEPPINKKDPTISIIVVTKDDHANLITTHNSFVFPDHLKKKVQLILVDGGSTDKTKYFIKSHSSKFSVIISEPDEGIYDAMNKGIKIANGEWSIFINAGDTFADPTVPEKVFEQLNPEIDVLYGDCILKYPGFNLLKKAGVNNDIWKGMITTHQSFIIKTDILKENLFNLDYKLGADFDQIFKLYKQKKQFKYIPIPIAAVDTTGVSNTKILSARCEHYKSLRKNDKVGLGIHLYYAFNFVYLIAISISRLLLPKKIYYSIVKTINRKFLIYNNESHNQS